MHVLTAEELRTQCHLGDEARGWTTLTRLIGVIGLVAACVAGYAAHDHYQQFLFSYLVAFAFFQTLTLGCLFFVIVNHLTGARWCVTVRRIAELAAGGMPIMALLALPILVPIWMGNHSLYDWTNHQLVEQDHLLHHKSPFLNVTFFTIRVVIYYAIWIGVSRFYLRNSRAQDQSGDPMITARMRSLSAPFLILFALSLTFFAFDFLMSLEAHWFSTIFGVYVFAGATLSSFCFITLMAMFFQERGRLKDCVTTEHYHDLGKYMFAFVFFWGYIAFSQFMLIWYADLPEETFWFKMRFNGAWAALSAFLLFGHFLVPFPGLLSRHIKRNKGTLAFWAVALLLMHYVDMYWLVKPSLYESTLGFGAMDIACMLGIGGVVIGTFLGRARGGFIAAVKDPYWNASLAFKNY